MDGGSDDEASSFFARCKKASVPTMQVGSTPARQSRPAKKRRYPSPRRSRK